MGLEMNNDFLTLYFKPTKETKIIEFFNVSPLLIPWEIGLTEKVV
jgi:hypothetical protein